MNECSILTLQSRFSTWLAASLVYACVHLRVKEKEQTIDSEVNQEGHGS